MPVDFLVKAYAGLHDLDLALAVQKVGAVQMRVSQHAGSGGAFLRGWIFPLQSRRMCNIITIQDVLCKV